MDVQGFTRSSNLFQVKELAILPVDDLKLPTFCLFKPPCAFSKLLQEEQKTNPWVEKRHHGIPWDSGHVPHNSWIRILQDGLKDAIRIYVKGLEKKKWLQEALPGK